ncbi:MAG TPA: hypothetical protein P5185_09325, partial [Oscillospiraceae bacterium]|nr:hypothetical protein [Oscillospiraceae bacterium]
MVRYFSIRPMIQAARLFPARSAAAFHFAFCELAHRSRTTAVFVSAFRQPTGLPLFFGVSISGSIRLLRPGAPGSIYGYISSVFPESARDDVGNKLSACIARSNKAFSTPSLDS